MQEFIPGQRWISVAETQMGLGTVLSVEHRTVTVLFMATGETRTYARETAPLTRVQFVPGDTVIDADGNALVVESIDEQDGLFTYIGHDENGQPARISESQLNNFMQLNRPTERLFNGQIDKNKWFELRHETLQHLNRLTHSDLRGLTGCRTSLIPHQLYIAHEVSGRYAPRVLLADEVGLGKTIEAGLILHRQLLTERARRALIIVPESLVHQWLVEMLRRFNLFFSVFDAERCEAVAEENDAGNPFHSEQLVLCSLEFLRDNPQYAEQAVDGEWDLLIVDEAHHLLWSPEVSSPEYQLVEQLSRNTRGVLLLTATPEQLGKAGHFARLRLLDPDRFADYEAFLAEEAAYEPVAQAVESLLEGSTIDATARQTLEAQLDDADSRALLDQLTSLPPGVPEQTEIRNTLVEQLLDRHGTGRVLFRNTRAAVKGFPGREVHAHALPLPEHYIASLAHAEILEGEETGLLLTPERLYRATSTTDAAAWTTFDPRVPWLVEQLAAIRPDKVLVITASAESALELADYLKQRSGIHAAVFHEGLSLIERDRAAAFFADPVEGTQVLVCSEIGSEGRNFQFAHHLVLFDLPLNPDLLEQRIGRLDRIGQQETIRIQVPYLQQSAQAALFRWIHEGLGAFEHTCPAGHAVYTQLQESLLEHLKHPDRDMTPLVDDTRTLHEQLNAELARGRDRLLELNSCRPDIANHLRERALAEDRHNRLPAYMERLFNCHDVNSELHREGCYYISPGEHMLTRFPGLPDDGMTITYERDIALANEDVQFLSWDHPLVSSALDMVQSSELGNTALSAVAYQGAQPGTLMLEALFVLEPAAVESLQTGRYLPPTTVRVVLDERGKRHEEQLGIDDVYNLRKTVNAETANRIAKAKEADLRRMVAQCEQLAHQQAPEILEQAHQQATHTLGAEIDRLKALQHQNPNVRDEEIHYFEQQLNEINRVIETAHLRLDALRVIVST
ncbi:ATP-dependent helicase HepA [Thiogranum longum]|uniref:RNA polymerase-associated protein RapA n=1 Tax=Thiogranum longum TaxID=1537524 RepID=A0A4R1H7Y6_9GAMM|nr:RNA polymerase-associated protein RapA [Thiogranum longum]TCK17944.1 ATP-dependent helicase HepA [Thiogranum longum]